MSDGGTASDHTISIGTSNLAENSLKGKFCAKLEEFLSTNLDNKRSSVMSDERYRELIAETKEAKQKKLRGQALTAKQHRRFKRFDVLSTTTTTTNNGASDGGICGKVERLIDRNSITSGDNVKYFCPAGELYDIIHSTHISMGHKREKSMEMELKRKYCNVTRVLIKMYLELCPRCQMKRETRAPRVKKPAQLACHSWDSNPQSSSGRESDIVSSGYNAMPELNYRCQVDLVDMQLEPDGDYRFILNYHDCLTKFVVLRPLKTKTAEEVAYHLIDVFCLLGAPCILHSDNGREFCNRVIKNLSNWSNIKLVNGKPRNYSQKQASTASSSECTNQEVRDSLITWMANEKTTKWSEGLKFVQSSMNRSFNRGIRRSPYEAMFGTPQRNGLLDTYLPKNIVQELQTEEDLEEALASQGMTVQQLLPESNMSGALKEKEADNNQEQPPSSILCVVCQKDTLMSPSTRINSCSFCKHPVHAMCATHLDADTDDGFTSGSGGNASTVVSAVCFLCTRKKNIDVERKGCKRSLELDGLTSPAIELPPPTPLNKKFPLVAAAAEVQTPTTSINQDHLQDRGRLVPRNFSMSSSMADAGLFTQPMTTVPSADGYFDCFYARNEFQTADESHFMQVTQDVRKTPASPLNSGGGGMQQTSAATNTISASTSSIHGFVIRCNCRIHCNDKKCSCKKNNVKCNAKCHGSTACANK